MKKAIIFTCALLAAMLFVLVMLAEVGKTQSEPVSVPQHSKCPAGSYDIDITKDGNPICKLEPTGCPYGDSIPLGPDCDKHDPNLNQPLITAPEPAPVAECGGK